MIRNNSQFNTQNSKLTKRIFLSPPHMGIKIILNFEFLILNETENEKNKFDKG